MNQSLTILNATQYLENEYFTNIQFISQSDTTLTLSATDEDDTTKLIQFESLAANKVCVSFLVDNEWIIYSILEE